MNDNKIDSKAFEISNKMKIYFNQLLENDKLSIEDRNAIIYNFTSNIFMTCCIYYNEDKSINIKKSTHNFIYLQEYMIDHFKHIISHKAD